MTIFLVGFMGSGKTYWGSRWAKKAGIPFFDLDEVIETKSGTSIAQLFEEKGEASFRKRETETLHACSKTGDCLIACGGGTACYNNNMSWMNANGLTVYLKASPAYILKRLAGEKGKRPLISHLNETDTLPFIEKKLEERAFYYGQAKIILEVEELSDNFVPGFIKMNLI